MEFTTENVERVVIEFYRNQDKVNRECHEWLKGLQASPEAWQIVWPLLQPDKILQVQFVAANTLHYKVSRCLYEVPESEILALKDKLCQTIAHYIRGPPIVLTRLGLTMGAFVARTIGHPWENPLEDLVGMFSPQNLPGVQEETVLKLLVQIFAFIPEHAQAHSNPIGHRAACPNPISLLSKKGTSLFGWLFKVFRAQQNVDLLNEILKAMSAWLKIVNIYEWEEIYQLVDTLVACCSSSVTQSEDQLCELTIEVLSAIIGYNISYQYPSLMLNILEKILPLQSSLLEVTQRQDMELTSSFYSLYITMADCHSKIVVEVCDPEASYNTTNPKNRDNVLALINLLLQCTDYPGVYPIDEIVSSSTISVWYAFVEDIQSYQAHGLKYVRIMQVFEEVYTNLARVLVRKAQYPVNTSDWHSDEFEQFRIYRQDVSDCLTYCFELRGWTMLNELVDWTDAQVSTVENAPDQMTQLWPSIESLLMGIRAVAENISDERDPLLVSPMSRAFSVIFRVMKLSQTHLVPKLFQAAIECVSSCSGMLYLYDGVVRNMIGFILEGLRQPEISTSSALALKTLSRDCTKYLTDFTPQILNACKNALDSGVMGQNDCIRLVFCIGKFLPFLPQEQLIAGANEIFAPIVTQLQNIATSQNQANTKPELKSQLVGILNILATLCSSMDNCVDSDQESSSSDTDEIERVLLHGQQNNNDSSQQQLQPQQDTPKKSNITKTPPLVPIVHHILPVLPPIANTWSRDEEVMTSLFSILKHTMSSIQDASPMVIEYAVQLVLISFRTHPFMSSTSLAKQIFLMLEGNVETQSQFLSEMHHSCSGRIKENRDVDFTESYLQLFAQLVRSHTPAVNRSGVELQPLLDFAIEGLHSLEIGVLKGSISFLSMVLEHCSKLEPSLLDYFKRNGPLVIQKALVGIGYVVPRTHSHNYADVLLHLLRHFPADFRTWLNVVLAVEGFPTVHANSDVKSKFYIKLTKERATKRMIQDAINEFAVSCRNMSGSEYAAATSKRI